MVVTLGLSQLAATLHFVGHLHVPVPGKLVRHHIDHHLDHGLSRVQSHDQSHDQSLDQSLANNRLLDHDLNHIHNHDNTERVRSAGHHGTELRASANHSTTRQADVLSEQCALFHLYLAMQACSSAIHTYTQISAKESKNPTIRSVGVILLVAASTQIRGPPVSI